MNLLGSADRPGPYRGRDRQTRAGLPGKGISFYIVPHNPVRSTGFEEHIPARKRDYVYVNSLIHIGQHVSQNLPPERCMTIIRLEKVK